MKLFYSPGACSLSPHIVLREAGIPYQLEKVDLKTHTTAGGADFYSVNSKGYVPTLQLDDGRVLTEGPAIVQYLADRKPESGLAPAAGTFERAQLQEWLNYIGTELHKSLGALFNPKLASEVKESTVAGLQKKFDYLAKQLSGKKFLLGDAFSVADAYLYTILRWADLFKIDLGKWPALQEYLARIAARPAVKVSLNEEGLS
ncbi:MAG: glutathione transferase GstA [Myxococcaceae bacterium]